MNPRSRISDWFLIIAFLVLLAGILLGTFFSWDFYSVQDNRGLAKKPDLASLKLVQIPAQFEVYFNDHFGFRNALIRRYNKLLKRYFGRKSGKVTLGERKWLFSSGTIPDYLGYARTKKEDLERWRLVIEGKRAWLAEKGICYVFVVPPNKSTIYSEYLPEEIALGKGETAFESLLAYMKDNSDVPILDLTPALLEEKKQRQIYFSGDAHWNMYGCFVGYRQLILSMKRCLPELSDPMPFDSRLFGTRPHVGDLIHMGGLDEDEYGEVGPCLQFGQLSVYRQVKIQDDWVIEALTRRHGEGSDSLPRHTYNHENELRAVIFHDSFMVAMPTFLARHFAQVENLWLRPDYNLLKKAVESYHPDVVIDEIQERFLSKLLPDDHPEWVAARERYAAKRLAARE